MVQRLNTHTHLSDGYMYPYESREGSVRSICASEYERQGDGSETGIASKGPVHLKQPQAMGRTELEIVTDGKTVIGSWPPAILMSLWNRV